MIAAADRAKILELQKERDEFPLPWQFERRREYLKGVLCEVVAELLWAIRWQRAHIARGDAVWAVVEKENINRLWKRVRTIQGELISQRVILAGHVRKDEITPEMIDRARAYPFTQLYEFRRNMARCPFHEDRTPSFMLMKDNQARCFGACGQSWDTIAFIRDREGLSFPDAVRRLQ
ncbi:MAG: CHC2 zinc finger domain-containing protein [Syntrophorhabdales bacterium]|jgi:hypothetical protein